MKTQLVHHFGSHFDFSFDGSPLFRYVYQPAATPSIESPKPYFHPLYNLAGDIATIHRPADCPWHRGLSLSFYDVGGHNFWGGWVATKRVGGPLPENHGIQQHRGWEAARVNDDQLLLVERLLWMTGQGERLLDERRSIHVPHINPAAGWWVLDLDCVMRNVTSDSLLLHSPQTLRLSNAGFGGLFWRGPWSFLAGNILASNSRSGVDEIGQPSPWLAYIGRHDETLRQSTVLIIDHPDNPRHPARWMARNDVYPGLGTGLLMEEPYTLAKGFDLVLRYRIVIAVGSWDHRRIEQFQQEVAPQPRGITPVSPGDSTRR